MNTSGNTTNSPHMIRVFGDPVLKMRCPEITEVDDALVKLSQDMLQTMRAARGVGLAAPQVGVQKRLFVYDAGNGPETIINPKITEADGEWTYEEGCLSVPGLFFSITRPNRIVFKGQNLNGDEIEYEATEFLGRVFQHELDHLDGILLLERLDSEQRAKAMKTLRERQMRNG